MLQPGEVDQEVAVDQLVRAPLPTWDVPTRRTCAFLYERYVRSGTGKVIPDHAFCRVPRWVFLEYLARFCDVGLYGSNKPDLVQLEPVVLSRNVSGWNTPRYYVFANSIEPIYRAIFDVQRLQTLGYATRSAMRRRFPDTDGQATWGFYFGVDYRALPHGLWRSGMIYLYCRHDFPPDYETVPYQTSQPIRPLARLRVSPWDWPLLDQVNGADIAAQIARQEQTFRGYPWTQDLAIHPKREERPLVEAVRTYLETQYAAPVNLPELGQRFGLSPFVLLRMFRAHVGLSPHAFQTQRRIAQARRLLTDGVSIAQVAVETGFCDQTHLTRAFRRIVGMTPGHYVRAVESPVGT